MTPEEEQREWLRKHHFSYEDFTKSGLDWKALVGVRERHVKAFPELQATGTSIAARLQLFPGVHSVKVRIKDADHLVGKILRKKLKEPNWGFEPQYYHQQITDLIGVRALHLFKDGWKAIHDRVLETWEQQEKPTAFHRDGDSNDVLDAFASAGCDVQRHEFGYRSVHYVFRTQPTKTPHVVELQVRTIFEEGWSEIDHRIRYPDHSDEPILAQFLTILNRLAGSADEMGTFVQSLTVEMRAMRTKAATQATQIKTLEAKLKEAVEKMSGSSRQKEEANALINNLSLVHLDKELLSGIATDRFLETARETARHLSGLGSFSAVSSSVLRASALALSELESFSPVPPSLPRASELPLTPRLTPRRPDDPSEPGGSA